MIKTQCCYAPNSNLPKCWERILNDREVFLNMQTESYDLKISPEIYEDKSSESPW